MNNISLTNFILEQGVKLVQGPNIINIKKYRASHIIFDYLKALTLNYAHYTSKTLVFSACKFLFYTFTIFQMIRSFSFSDDFRKSRFKAINDPK